MSAVLKASYARRTIAAFSVCPIVPPWCDDPALPLAALIVAIEDDLLTSEEPVTDRTLVNV